MPFIAITSSNTDTTSAFAMDRTILANTQKYAKYGVLKNVEKPANAEHVSIKEIYVVEKEIDPSAWRAILVDSFCQFFPSNTLVLFVTQANSLASATQTIQRAKTSPLINTIIPSTNIYRSNKTPNDDINEGNYMIVDFWNARNMGKMLEFVREFNEMFASIIVVVDEADQGHIKGVKERLSFIHNVEKSAPDSIVKVIFVTATVANLSKSILQVAKANVLKFKTGVVSDIIHNAVVEHQFAEPHSTYVGASWFKNTEDVWCRLIFPKKTTNISKEELANLKIKTLMAKVKAMPERAKELSLFVTSTLTCDHLSLAERLYKSEYNVTVEMNGTNSKNFTTRYVDKYGGISSWDIPYSQIDARADRGDLETYRNSDKKLICSGILSKEDYSMAHVIQAALFMTTDADERIKANVSAEEYRKLEAINNVIMNKLEKPYRRPDDYPDNPRVALIAGHLAGRGITFQNPDIDFTCTSFCFTDTRDAVQRGATNTQRFGRACGMLMDVFARSDKKPILIATEGIMKSALANEAALKEKAEQIQNGTLFSLKDMVTKDEWDQVIKKTGESIKGGQSKSTISNTDEIKKLVDSWWKADSMIGKILKYVYGKGAVLENELKQYIESVGSKNPDELYRHLIRNTKDKQYGLVFMKSCVSKITKIKIRPAAIEYINTLNH